MARGVHVRVGKRVADLYFSPGYLGPPGPSAHGELWATGLSAGGALVGLAKVWDAPAREFITCLAWTTLTRKLYVGTQSATFPDANRIYALSPGGAPSLVVGPYQDTPESFDPAAPTAVAEFGGSLYLSHVGGPNASGIASYVTRFDPVGLTNTLVTTADAFGGSPTEVSPAFQGFGTGGIAVAGGVLYWCSGTRLWSSPDGSAWSLFAALATAPSPGITPGALDLGGLVTNPADGAAYVGGIYSASGDPTAYDHRRVIYRIAAGGGLTQDLLAGTDGSTHDGLYAQRNQIAGLGVRYDAGDTAIGPVAADRSYATLTDAPPLDVWARSGGWAVDADVRPLVAGTNRHGLHGKPFAASKGRTLLLAGDTVGSGGVVLLGRDPAGGAWSVLHTFAGYTTASDGANLGPLARVNTTIKCHEM